MTLIYWGILIGAEVNRNPATITRRKTAIESKLSIEELSDGELVRHYLKSNCAEAFRQIVLRYGGLVMSVCKRYVNDESLAEDAFQETFVVLATRAKTIRYPEHLSSWLYGVAIRTSHQLMRTNQGLIEQTAYLPECDLSQIPEKSEIDPMKGESIDAILNQELEQLPDRLRAPLVLCYLMGETHAVAAQKLDVPVGSMSQRLKLAKRKLQIAMRRRGIIIPILVIGWLLSQLEAKAKVPSHLVDATIVGAGLATSRVVGSSTVLKSLNVWWQPQTWSLAMIGVATVTSVIVLAGSISLGAYLNRDRSFDDDRGFWSANLKTEVSSPVVEGCCSKGQAP